MRVYFEWGWRQFNKSGEELCGDNLAISRSRDAVTLALSDGLGSGVKANILSMLTTRIAMHLLENDLPLEDVVETLGETLPVCRERKLAYSTFAIAQFLSHGRARIVECDTPPTVVLRNRIPLNATSFSERTLGGKRIRESRLDVRIGDWIVFLTDGVLNAGIGGVYPLGWGYDEALRFLERHAHPNATAQELADKVAGAVDDLYAGQPGDDVSVAVIKVRKKMMATVVTGPPENPERDGEMAARLDRAHGKKAVCGGATAQIVAARLHRPLDVDLQSMTQEVPARARIEGIDLVTEGILTLTRAMEMLRSGATGETVRFRTDGASALVRMLLAVDHAHFLVGRAVNPAHQNPELPGQLGIRMAVVKDLAQELRARGIEATIETI